MPTLVYSSEMCHRTHQVYSTIDKHYTAASKLIDAIFAEKKGRVVRERNRFSYIPGDGTRKMVIRLKRFS
jgi:hypothetical protein